MLMFKTGGSFRSLRQSHKRERELIAFVEDSIDAGELTGGLLEELIAECRSRSVAEPQEASWRFLLGRFLTATGDPLEAHEALEAAAELDRGDPRITAHLGIWYQAAFLAVCGERANVDLPAFEAGPALTAGVASFAGIADVPASALASRAEALLRASRRFAMNGRDSRFIDAHVSDVRALPIHTQAVEPTPIDVIPLSRAS
jgi:hypothetical protein